MLKDEIKAYIVVCRAEGIEIHLDTLREIIEVAGDISAQEFTGTKSRTYTVWTYRRMMHFHYDLEFFRTRQLELNRFLRWLTHQEAPFKLKR